MPDDHGGGQPPNLPNHVKAYFTRRNKNPNDLPVSTLQVFATLSPQEVDVLDRLGATLQAQGADLPLYTCALH
jgi:hypothetical protein